VGQTIQGRVYGDIAGTGTVVVEIQPAMNNTNSITNITVQIGTKALWAPALVFILHAVTADWLGHEPYVDPVIHFCGGAAIAFFFWRAAECCQRSISGRWVFGLTTLVAIAWEIMEYLLLTYRGWAMNWDPANSFRDLFLGMCGAALIIFLNSRNKRSQYESDK